MSNSVMKSPSAPRTAALLTEQMSPGGADSLVSQLAEEMAKRWHAGARPQAEEFLSRHPELCSQPEAAARLIYEEICLRQESGQETASIEVVQRFPQWREQLQDILCQGRPRRPTPSLFPKVGETMGGYRIVAELGHGIRGRVFLATQPALAERPVALKITSCDGGEHLSLARLQHTHIVPLYSVQDYLDRNLRILCMPYFGGATLSQILERLRGRRLDELTGQDLLDALDQAQPGGVRSKSEIRNPKSEKPGANSDLGFGGSDLDSHQSPVTPHQFGARGGSPVRQVLAQLSYTRAICWIGSCLADALEYAHERGLVHLDLKPSNVLLATDGQPMLLDFHLAQQPLQPGGPAPTWLGGTPAYMSPEQKAAITAMRERRSVVTPVDGRSDIYSLGVLLHEAFGGGTRDTGSSSPREQPLRLIEANSQITPGLADVIGKCLQPQPQDRYPQASDLAADLRRYVTDLPLLGVSNRSWSERWRKWRRRRPHALVLYVISMAFFVLVAAAGGGALTQILHRYDDARRSLDAEQVQIAQGNLDRAEETLAHGLVLVDTVPFSDSLRRELAGQLQWVREKQTARNFHEVAEQIRLQSVADSLTARELMDLEASCRAAWNSLPLMATRLGDLEGEDRQRLRTDFLDLAVLEADLHVRLASKNDVPAARQWALNILEEAEGVLGPSSVLSHERQVLAEAAGQTELARQAAAQAKNLPISMAWEHCTLGRSHLQSGNLDAAVREFREAVRLEPGGLWPNYYYGISAYRRGRAKDALQAFSVCLGAANRLTAEPGNPKVKLIQAQILYNRALAQAATGANAEAIEDYNSVLDLDPDLGKAALNRGVLHFKAKQYEKATADLMRALNHNVEPVVVHYNLALVYSAQNNRKAALVNLQQALKYDPGNKDAQTLLKQLTGHP
jgi:serine/threonine protein kinase/lipoprotein NlpI